MRADGGAGVAARLRAEGLDAGRWGNGAGDRYGVHRHDYDKVIAVEWGSIDFGLPATGGKIGLSAGDRLELPAGTDHDAVVGGDGVSCLEAHLPAGTLGARQPRRVPAGEW
jgi:quercetin dioxygenase-like cupin family protein